MNRVLLLVWTVIGLALTAFVVDWDDGSQLDQTDVQAIFKARYIFYVASQSDWPDERKTGDFVIAIYGNENLYEDLVQKYSSDPISSQKLKVVNAKTVGDLKGAHLACVSRENSDKLSEVVQFFKESSTIIVSQKEGALDQGSHVNFVVVDNKLLYELNQQAAEKRGVSFGNKLIQFAVNP